MRSACDFLSSHGKLTIFLLLHRPFFLIFFHKFCQFFNFFSVFSLSDSSTKSLQIVESISKTKK